MADSDQLVGVSEENGFLRRTGHFLLNKAQAVVSAATPDANELTLAKLLIDPDGSSAVSVQSVTRNFARVLVTDDTVATALASNDFKHTAFTDVNFEAAVNALWPEYAKSVA